uniref:Estrogen-related receptor gamma-like n=1 Tax=Dermatophagoides pteronyssinus TaxID=6956 RepID=A0A6P6XXP1_DERPT|nr:estrogen-related receptor gamma-like [Dermatophagoides pteronyssinus]
MSTTNATIISPLINIKQQQQQQQIIKQEIIKDEDDECIRYISTSGIISSGGGGQNLRNQNNNDNNSSKEELSLDVRNGHNYTATIINKSSTSNNQNTSPHQQQQHQQRQTLLSHRGGITTTTTTANHQSSSINIKRIEFPISKHHHHHHQINTTTTPNTNTTTTQTTSINVDLFNAAAAAAAAAANLHHTENHSSSSPPPSSSSPFNIDNNNDNHHQEMFCSSTVSGDLITGSNTTTSSSSTTNNTICLDTTNDLINNNNNNNNKIRDTSPKRLCLVCGDTASGFHYGVASCEACKAFFKRTIQGNIEYTCPATNNCEINKRRRKACQACRFQKCLRMGMLKEGVRLDRVRGGRQKYRRTSESPYNHQGSQQNNNNYCLKKSNIDDNRIIAALIKCEPEPIISNANLHLYSPNSSSSNNNGISSVSSSQYKNLCILSELVDKELVATIAWAKQIPGFTDLILNDQMRLLQSTWAEILSLSLAFRSQQYSSPPNTPACLSPNNASSTTTNSIFNKLVFATDFIIDDQQAAQCNADDLFAHLMQLIRRLNQLKIAKEEYLLMKAIILTNADIQLENPESVIKLRDTLIQTLQDCVSILRPQTAINHLSQLFLCLPLLRQLDNVTRRLWLNILQEGSIPMQKLFVEMLESNATF